MALPLPLCSRDPSTRSSRMGTAPYVAVLLSWQQPWYVVYSFMVPHVATPRDTVCSSLYWRRTQPQWHSASLPCIVASVRPWI